MMGSYQVTDKEEWIQSTDEFTDDIKLADSRFSYLQVIHQIHYSPGCLKTYKKYVIRINGTNDFSNINPVQINVNDEFESWSVHSFKICRGNLIIDKIENLKFTQLQREVQLENKVFTGLKTFVCHVEDLQVGDIIQYEYTVINRSPFTFNHFEYFFPTSFIIPVFHLKLKIHCYDSSKECRIRVYNSASDELNLILENPKDYSYERKNIDPVYLEDNIPSDRNPFSYIEFSNCLNWKHLGEFLLPYYQIPSDGLEKLKSYVDTFNTTSEKHKKLELLIKHVQQNIAYQSISINENTYVPHPPEMVIDRNFGDCKDKSLLLKSLLFVCGVESSIVLVNTFDSKSTSSRLPSLSSFNHVILCIYYDGNDYLVDPTNSVDCFTFENCSEPKFYNGLFLQNEPQLQHLSSFRNSTFKRKVIEKFTITGDSAEFTVEDKYYYFACNWILQSSLTQDVEGYKKNFLNYYFRRYKSISFKKNENGQDEFHYDLDYSSYVVTVYSTLLIQDFWNSSIEDGQTVKKASFFPGDLIEVLTYLQGTERKHPHGWVHHAEFEYFVEIDYDFSGNMGNMNEEINNELFVYAVSTIDNPGHFEYRITYESKTDVIEAKDFARLQKVVNPFIDLLGFSITKRNNAIISDTKSDNKWQLALIGLVFLLIINFLRHGCTK